MTTEDQIIQIVNSSLNREPKLENTDLSSSIRDLGIDSLDFMLILVKIQEETGINISENDAGKVVKLADIVEFIKSPRA